MNGENPAGESFADLWHELDQAREEKRWTREQLARKVSELSGQRCNAKTVHDRMTNGRRIPWSEARWFVQALNLDAERWRDRWSRTEAQRREGAAEHSVAARQPSAAEQGRPVPQRATAKAGGASPDPAATRRRRIRTSALTGATVVIIVAALGIWAYGTESDEPAQGEEVACARVAVSSAKVYAAPGDTEPLTTKYRGEKISMPRNAAAEIAADGRRYQKVRTPTRTPSGYAYMLADTMTPESC